MSEFIGKLKPTESTNQFQFVDGENVWVFKVGDDSLVSYTLSKREGKVKSFQPTCLLWVMWVVE
ncbi:hypothetical protein VCR3J2_230112 [Vibrio coralliirubri]|nr:hypothetical protein VCR3J2_230112 [Vibrio coralliirubri]